MKIRIDLSIDKASLRELTLRYVEHYKKQPTKKELRSFVKAHFDINADNEMTALGVDLDDRDLD